MLTMVQGIPGMLLSLKNQADTLRGAQPATASVINVLPADDPFVTAHRASRSRYFSDSDQKLQRRVFNSTGAAKPTILLNGQIVGVWQWQAEAGQEALTWQLLVAVEPEGQSLIEAAVNRVAAFIDPGITVRQIEAA